MIIELKDVTIDDNNRSVVQVARTGKNMIHRLYGKITILKEDLEQMVRNFKLGARGLFDDKDKNKPTLAIDFKHEEGNKAAGWINKLEMKEDPENPGQFKLFADVEWTPVGKEKIEQKEFKFLSPAIHRNFQNQQTKKKFPVILRGAGLTNIPFLSGMEAVSLLDEGTQEKIIDFLRNLDDNENQMLDIDQILNAISNLSDEEKAELLISLNKGDKKMTTELDKKKTNLDESTDTKPSENELKLTEDNQKLADENKTLKANQTFLTMLSDGTAVPAQKEAFLAGDMVAFAKAAVDINLDDKGSGGDNESGDTMTADEAQKKIIKLADEYMKENEVPIDVAMKAVTNDPANEKTFNFCE